MSLAFMKKDVHGQDKIKNDRWFVDTFGRRLFAVSGSILSDRIVILAAARSFARAVPHKMYWTVSTSIKAKMITL